MALAMWQGRRLGLENQSCDASHAEAPERHSGPQLHNSPQFSSIPSSVLLQLLTLSPTHPPTPPAGTGPEVFGNTNAPPAVTHSAIIYALRCMVSLWQRAA